MSRKNNLIHFFSIWKKFFFFKKDKKYFYYLMRISTPFMFQNYQKKNPCKTYNYIILYAHCIVQHVDFIGLCVGIHANLK